MKPLLESLTRVEETMRSAAPFPEGALRESMPKSQLSGSEVSTRDAGLEIQLSKESRKQKLISYTPLHSLTNNKCQIIAGTNG